jgi:transcriptional regulator with GAF, ATPase, and Fis domain
VTLFQESEPMNASSRECASAADRRPSELRLVTCWAGKALAWSLKSGATYEIGRVPEAEIWLANESVSRRHAVLAFEGDTLTIEDLDSSNGTWLDGLRLVPGERTSVAPGSIIEVGPIPLALELQGATKEPERRSNIPVSTVATRPLRDTAVPPNATCEIPCVQSSSLVIEDPAMVALHEVVDVAARSALSVILLGETGVGKEVIAERVHQASPRAHRPFLKVNCAALVESLLEAELFGYEKGAFTGANQAKAGLLESADGGTVFLDELGEMPLTTQAKLLRVLESGEVTRVGGVKPRQIDVRFVSATNRDLGDSVALGQFRQDLFFRLDGVSIRIPPLRERPSEIARLARHFLDRGRTSVQRPNAEFDDEALNVLKAYAWPGNVRELRNVVMRTLLFVRRDVITSSDLRFDALGAPSQVSVPRQVPAVSSYPPASSASGVVALPSAEVFASYPPGERTRAEARAQMRNAERERIAKALELCVGNQTRAAQILGISRRALVTKLDRYGFPRPRKLSAAS